MTRSQNGYSTIYELFETVEFVIVYNNYVAENAVFIAKSAYVYSSREQHL